jgi:hypothetical protein
MGSGTSNLSDNFQAGMSRLLRQPDPEPVQSVFSPSSSGHYVFHRFTLPLTETIALDARRSTVTATSQFF